MTAAKEEHAAYPDAAVKLVVGGYSAINGELKLAKARGIIAKGATVVDFIRTEPWDSKPLLNSQKFGEFTAHLETERIDDVLLALWYILQNVCDEQRLRPSIAIDPSTAESIVRLSL